MSDGPLLLRQQHPCFQDPSPSWPTTSGIVSCHPMPPGAQQPPYPPLQAVPTLLILMTGYWTTVTEFIASLSADVLENCNKDNDHPMGIYCTRKLKQAISPTSSMHPAAPSSNCHALPTISMSPAITCRENWKGFEMVNFEPSFSGTMPVPQ
ncbi:hypothetical protein BDQ17DRAFT_1332414 [Cyathus striatus]|nr:hypothetical protein BDQ17DRAFT_1332414 [Cyathus striatus]